MILLKNEKKHINAIKEIADLTLGEDCANDVLNSEISIHAQIDGKIVGYATGIIDFPHILGTEKLTLTNLYPCKTGIICNVATHPDYQRKGIGYTLTQEIIKTFQLFRQNTIVASAWKSKNGVNISGVLEKLGFIQIVEIPEFWKDCPCIQCDPNECLCSAVIYELKI